MIYLKNDLQYRIKNDLFISNFDAESLIVEITIKNTSNFISFVVTGLQI